MKIRQTTCVCVFMCRGWGKERERERDHKHIINTVITVLTFGLTQKGYWPSNNSISCSQLAGHTKDKHKKPFTHKMQEGLSKCAITMAQSCQGESTLGLRECHVVLLHVSV